MRRTGLLFVVAVALAATANAQTPTSGKVHCSKPDPAYSIDVADHAGHAMTLSKASCTWSDATAVAGLMAKTGEDVTTGEMNGTTGHDTGYHIATMDNGDKIVVHFMGTATFAKDGQGTVQGKWTYVSGTGKLKGIKGGGTYKGTGSANGSDVTVEGTYTLPTTAPAEKK